MSLTKGRTKDEILNDITTRAKDISILIDEAFKNNFGVSVKIVEDMLMIDLSISLKEVKPTSLDGFSSQLR